MMSRLGLVMVTSCVWNRGTFLYLTIHGAKLVCAVTFGRCFVDGKRVFTAFAVRIHGHRLGVVHNSALTFHEFLYIMNERHTHSVYLQQHTQFLCLQEQSYVQYLCESITLYDSVLDPIRVQVHAEVEVFPMVILSIFILWQTLPSEPIPLYYPGILHPGLDDAHAVVLKVVINHHSAHSVLLYRGVQNTFLEVCIVAQHL